MYLHLNAGKNVGDISVEVKNHGALQFSSLGTSSSQRTDHPFAVFKIAQFTGIDCIDTDDLYEELLRRYGSEGLLERMQRDLSNEDVATMVKERLGRG
jgi:hypothetical protein